jgi:hypothetical protein
MLHSIPPHLGLSPWPSSFNISCVKCEAMVGAAYGKLDYIFSCKAVFFHAQLNICSDNLVFHFSLTL